MVGITMISIGLFLQQDNSMQDFKYTKIKQIDIKNMATSANVDVIDTDSEEVENLLLSKNLLLFLINFQYILF